MIKANDYKVKFRGRGVRLIAEYTMIGRHLRKILPAELVDHAIFLSKLSDEDFDSKINGVDNKEE